MPTKPIAALSVAGYGSLLGSMFPVMAIMTVSDIGGGLSAAADAAALVNTIQNVGAVAGIVIAPAFAAALGRGRTMQWTGIGFLLAAIAAATAPNLPIMLVARFWHGFFGGALPLLFMLLVMTSLRAGAGRFEGIALFAASTTLPFGMAAIVGGLLSDNFGWRALFWIQAATIIPYIAAAARVLRQERGDLSALARVDWAHYLLLIAGISALTIGLSEGERFFWLETWWVPGSIAGGILACIMALKGIGDWHGRPLLVLAVFRRPTFSWAILLSAFFRFGSLFAIFIIPQFLARLQGYRAVDTGALLVIMVPATACGLLLAYFAARRVDARIPLSAGLACFTLAAWLCRDLTSDWAAEEIRVAAAFAGLGLGLFQVAVLRFAVEGAGLFDGPSVGIVFNLARVVSTVSGIAFLSHLLAEREKFHSARIVESLAATSPETTQRLASVGAAFARMSADPVSAQNAASASLARAASGQAFTLAFSDTLIVTAAIMLLGAIFVWALPALPPEPDSPLPHPAPPASTRPLESQS
ncbi:MFS transporter [Novosphingobium sp. ST904]|uniref:MFS transporter n=2 Tax=Novosphingobium sp. ST904 TaxID=1684385 RepID=UPI00140552F3|nr:MFS transporter [Novosphingobium sp. ST904]